MAPPISMHPVLVFQATKTIGVKAHCLRGDADRLLKWRAWLIHRLSPATVLR